MQKFGAGKRGKGRGHGGSVEVQRVWDSLGIDVNPHPTPPLQTFPKGRGGCDVSHDKRTTIVSGLIYSSAREINQIKDQSKREMGLRGVQEYRSDTRYNP